MNSEVMSYTMMLEVGLRNAMKRMKNTVAVHLIAEFLKLV